MILETKFPNYWDMDRKNSNMIWTGDEIDTRDKNPNYWEIGGLMLKNDRENSNMILHLVSVSMNIIPHL